MPFESGKLANKCTTQFFDAFSPIWLDDVQCTGQESSISDCDQTNRGVHNFAHYEDAGVSCSGKYRLYQNILCGYHVDYIPDEFPVRLVGGSSPAEGRLEMLQGMIKLAMSFWRQKV